MIKKFIALSLVLVMLLAAVSCSGGISGNTEMLTVNSKSVSYDMCRYFYINHAAAYDDDELSEKDGEIRAQVISSLRMLYAPIVLWEGLGRSADDSIVQNYVDEYIDDIIENTYSGGISQYRKDLAKNHLTEEVFEFLITSERICELLYDEYVLGEGAANGIVDKSEAAIEAAINGDDFIRVVQIMIRNDYGEDEQENQTLAENLLKRAVGGEDFDTLIARYSDDFTMTPDGYYITRNQLTKPLEEAAFSLKVGEISDIVESNGSLHILKRLPKQDSYIESHYGVLKEQYYSSCVSKHLETTAEKLTVVTASDFSTCNFLED